MAKDPGIGLKVLATVTGVKGHCNAGHQQGEEHACFFGSVLPLDAVERALGVVHRGLPQLLGVHLTQTFESLDLHPAPTDLVQRFED